MKNRVLTIVATVLLVAALAGVAVADSPVPVTGVSLSRNTLVLTVGQSDYLRATVNPATATNKNVTWASSDTSVATVQASSDARVTGRAVGTAIIRVTTADGSFVDECVVTVRRAARETPQTGGGIFSGPLLGGMLIMAAAALGLKKGRSAGR